MNKQRRKEIQALINSLEEIKYQIEELKEQEEEAFDNLPESIQYSEKGEAMESAIDYLDSAALDIENVTDNLQSATEQ